MVCAHSAQAGNWSLGAGVLVTPEPYRGHQTRVYPAPIVNYEGDNFYFRSLTAGYYLWNDQQNQLSIMGYYLPQHFKPGDSDDAQMKLLDKRRSTLMAGLAYSHNADWGTIRTALSGDMLNNSDGILGDAAYLYRFTPDNWTLVPGVGVTWSSGNQTDYYYGISGNESRRSGLDSYTPGNSWAPYAELTANYRFNQNWNAFVTGRYIRLSSEVKDSPMIDKSYTGILLSGVSYNF
ncbi:MltA-interacting protein MipA [Chania multitudinisentens RB-25]|uniref:MltA-interacting protein MipA n=1 Tax=Chania multitudinisentens RB-25 TaxID=1441930 RepID=W0L7R9_9GAMM|nr:MipA/OmpV family protein [Chania multitudinisentens]AHG18302.2 MltA-interacting protein MipA [Chania multitudinisentens RB-25]